MTRTPWRVGGVDREAAPAAADVEQRSPGLQPELRADQLELRLLGLLERLRPAREDRAAVGHRLVEEEREELVADVVVVAYRARRRARCVWRGAARAQLGAGRRAAAASARTRAPRRRRAGARRGAVDRRRLPAVEQPHHRVEVVDLEVAGHVGAAEAELARRAQRVRERARRAHGEGRAAAGSVAGSSVPSQNSTVNGRSGMRRRSRGAAVRWGRCEPCPGDPLPDDRGNYEITPPRRRRESRMSNLAKILTTAAEKSTATASRSSSTTPR